MTNDELTVHVEVLEVRLTKLATTLMMLLDAIDDGTAPTTAKSLREMIATDIEEWE